MPKILGIKFSPLWVPLQRRLEALCVALMVFDFLVIWLVGIYLLYYLLTTPYMQPLALLYAAWFVYDRNTPERGGRRSKWIRNLPTWNFIRDYFPITLTKTANLDPKKNYIIGYHPHGIMSLGAIVSFGSEATGFSQKFPNITPYLMTLNANFNLPIHRERIMSFGLCSVSKESCDYILSQKGKGNAVCIVIGGAAEVLDAEPKKNVKLTLKRRKGFAKLAIMNGASLVPAFSFGENETYGQVVNPEGSKLRRFQNWFQKKVGVAPAIVFGRGLFQYSFGPLPFRRKIEIVVGSPIDVVQNSNPTQEEIDKVHNQYITSLSNLFNKHKVIFGEPYTNLSLKFV